MVWTRYSRHYLWIADDLQVIFAASEARQFAAEEDFFTGGDPIGLSVDFIDFD